jgi:hypothetical protein
MESLEERFLKEAPPLQAKSACSTRSSLYTSSHASYNESATEGKSEDDSENESGDSSLASMREYAAVVRVCDVMRYTCKCY